MNPSGMPLPVPHRRYGGSAGETTAEKAAKKVGQVFFEIPEGFDLPPGKELNETFESVAEVRIVGDGKLELVALDGVQIPRIEEPGMPAEGPDDFEDAVEKGLA